MPKYKLHKVLIGGGASSNNKCNNLGFPALPSIVNTDRSITKRIIAIGDIHGDLDLAINCLEVCQVIERVDVLDDEKTCVYLKYKDEIKPRIYKWIGTNTIVVQVGDQVDRCRPVGAECSVEGETINDEASDLTIMFFFHDLHLVAINSPGCAVYSLLGNHELLNVLGNLRYVSYKGLEEFSTENLDKFKTGNTEIKMKGRTEAFAKTSPSLLYKSKSNISNFMACSRVSAIIIDGYLFVHAGVLEKLISYTSRELHVKKIDTIHTINEAIRKWLLNLDTQEDKEYIGKFLGGKTLSPFWPRIFGTLPSELDKSNKLCSKYVQPVLNDLNLKGIVVGHTPQLKFGISSTCSSSVWRIDVASSQAFEKVIKIQLENDTNGKSEQEKTQAENEMKSIRRPQVLEIKLGSETSEDTFKVIKLEKNI
jgi:hypothetical protein